MGGGGAQDPQGRVGIRRHGASASGDMALRQRGQEVTQTNATWGKHESHVMIGVAVEVVG